MEDSFIPFTAQAFEELKKKMEHFQMLRKEVVLRLQAAREMGDLSENAAYSGAKFELGRVNRELRQLHYLLKNGKVISKAPSDGTISFGSCVTLSTQQKDLRFQLVSQHESDPSKQKLSMESPIGKAILHKKAGDVVSVETPQGSVEYTIVSVT